MKAKNAYGKRLEQKLEAAKLAAQAKKPEPEPTDPEDRRIRNLAGEIADFRAQQLEAHAAP